MDDHDSTNHGWGYEIGAILAEAELKEKLKQGPVIV